jgi:hypothetical protein
MAKFLFSLDCELGWGEPDPPDSRWDALRADPSYGRDTYKKILDIFREYKIPATWAFVGHLFLDGCTPSTHYVNNRIEKYDPYTNISKSPLYYADDLVSMVYDDEINHEIAAHSFSHTPYTKLSEEEARQDVQNLIDIAESNRYEFTSFVFPKDQIAHTDILSEHGFSVYRGEIKGTNHTYKSGFRALMKNPKQFINCPSTKPVTDDRGLVRLSTSRLLRDERWWFLQPRRLKKGITSMDPNSHIHLTVHPHNFIYDNNLFRTFDSVLSIVDDMRKKNQIKIATMGESSPVLE